MGARRYGISFRVFHFLVYGHECFTRKFTGKYTNRNVHTKLHPGLE